MKRASALTFALLGIGMTLGCGPNDPRYGEASLSAAAPHVTLSGTTFGEGAALELAPGCPGFLDAQTPGHVVHVNGELAVDFSASSDTGPLALAVTEGDEVRCDADEGSGHAPSLSFDGAGEYLVYVASLNAPGQLPYELRIDSRPTEGEPVAAEQEVDVNVTLTSAPTGATVTDSDGEAVGTTPAMFVVRVPRDQLGQERTWNLALAGHEETSVTGELTEGALVLHGQMTPLGPQTHEAEATGTERIRDYQSTSLTVQIAPDCPITSGEVEVDITHSFIADLRVVLQAPWGDTVTLHRHGGGGGRNIRRTYDWDYRRGALQVLAGHPTRGEWRLTVYDDAGADTGVFNRFRLSLTCDPSQAAGVAVPTTVRPGQTTSITPPRPSTSPPPTPGGNANASIDTPSRADVVRVMSQIRPRVEQCSVVGGSVPVRFTVGSNGRVQSAVATSGTSAERNCVERVARSAVFPPFRRPSFSVVYPFRLPPPRGS